MVKIFYFYKCVSIVAFSFFAVSAAQAKSCHTETIDVKSKNQRQKIEYFKIEDTPVDRANVQSQMLVSGIYQFVAKKNGAGWVIYRCAKENSAYPIYDASNCKVKNDFQFGSFVAKDNEGNHLQKVSLRGDQVLGISLPSTTDTPEYQILFKTDEIAVKNYNSSQIVKVCKYDLSSSTADASVTSRPVQGKPSGGKSKAGSSN